MEAFQEDSRRLITVSSDTDNGAGAAVAATHATTAAWSPSPPLWATRTPSHNDGVDNDDVDDEKGENADVKDDDVYAEDDGNDVPVLHVDNDTLYDGYIER